MTTSPEIAVVTNVAPNHLDMHKGMEEYVASKKNVFLHQHPGDKVVLNRDNEITLRLCRRGTRPCDPVLPPEFHG